MKLLTRVCSQLLLCLLIVIFTSQLDLSPFEKTTTKNLKHAPIDGAHRFYTKHQQAFMQLQNVIYNYMYYVIPATFWLCSLYSTKYFVLCYSTNFLAFDKKILDKLED